MALVRAGRRRGRVRRIPQPVHDALRRAVRARDAGRSRSMSRLRRPTRTSAGISAAMPPSWRSAIVDELAGIGATPSGWREASTSQPLRAYEPGDERRARRPARPAQRRRAHRRAAARGPRRRLGRRPLHRLGEHVLAGRVARPHDDGRHRVPVDRPRVPVACPAPRWRKPESTIVLTTGDGGGLMALADLESAVRVAGGRGHGGGVERRAPTAPR